MIGLFGLFPIIFPLIGFIFMFFGFKKGIKTNRLLTIGYLTEGKLINTQPTNTRVNNQLVYKLTFSFRARDGLEYNAIAKTHQTYKLEDEPVEKLLYDSKNPNKAVMFDNISASLKIKEDGTIDSGSFFSLVKIMFIPVISLLVHGTIIYFFLFEFK